MSSDSTVGVLGGGAWGRALATAIARTGTKVCLLSRRGPGSMRDTSSVEVVDSVEDLGARARLIVLAVPSDVLREIAHELGASLDGSHLLVHAIRGLSRDDLSPLSEILREETPVKRVGALGGPVLANELEAGLPSVLVSGSNYPEVNAAVSRAFASDRVRVYTTRDLHGLEISSALMGCLAVGVGYAQRVGVNAGIVATLISRGVEEAALIAAAAGGRERTLLGLAGYGDLLAAIAQKDRPEVLFGAALGEGKSVADALAAAKQRVEAAELIPRVAAWVETHKLACPIFRGLAMRLREPIEPSDMVQHLMASPSAELA